MLVVIKGAGDLATGVAMRLWRSGIQVVMTETNAPTAIRRTVAFSDAVRTGRTQVEDVEAVRAESPDHALEILRGGRIPVLADPEAQCIGALQPDAVVDAILAKRNVGTAIDDAPIVIGLGPGFTAGSDCHAIVETKRGHSLGRVLHEGSAIPNTGIPGMIGGVGEERVLRAPADGTFHATRRIGDMVSAGDTIATVAGEPMVTPISGVLRGLLPDDTVVHKGMKSGDVDPRGNASYCCTVSDKALSVGGGVLEAILELSGVLAGQKQAEQEKQREQRDS